MKYLIEPVCVDHWDTYRHFSRIYKLALFGGRFHRAMSCLPHFLFGLTTLTGLVLFITENFTLGWYGFAAIVWIAYFPYLIFLKVTPEQHFVKAGVTREQFRKYIFDNRVMLIIDGKAHGGNKKTAKEYSQIRRMYEFSDGFYIEFNKKDIIAVDKNGFKTGTPEILHSFLADRICSSKYFVCK